MTLEESLLPENMILLYAQGAFPMADEDGKLEWYLPQKRAIIPLNNFNIPRSLRKFMETSDFDYTYDKNTIEIIRACADRKLTWITEEIIKGYEGLNRNGFLHSIGALKNGKLAGGLYGVSFRGAFFGESMFSRISQASKSALVKLLHLLKSNGFKVLDVQFTNEHLEMFGVEIISFEEYEELLREAYKINPKFKEISV